MSTAARSVQNIVENQVKRWELERKRREAEQVRRRPVITISREFGARGAELGAAVSQEMGFTLWDQGLVHAIAEESNASEMLISTLDEHTRSSLADLLPTLFVGSEYSQARYHHDLVRVVRTISEHGGAVVVGRGSQFILPGRAALHVRVVAPLEMRIRGVAHRRKITEADARAETERIDRDRAAFVRDYFMRDATEPTAYDVIINTESFALDRCARIVAAAYEAKFGATA